MQLEKQQHDSKNPGCKSHNSIGQNSQLMKRVEYKGLKKEGDKRMKKLHGIDDQQMNHQKHSAMFAAALCLFVLRTLALDSLRERERERERERRDVQK